jgi:alpha-beta hydrolase superfamily lysophospholipase
MSEITYISIRQKDGYVTKLTLYACPQKPKASILILHGMADHQKRYQGFAEYLVKHDYDVYSYDHRGHGTDKKLSELGFFASEDGYKLVIEDAIAVSNYIEQNNRCNRFFLFGHSMGSFISRNVLQSYDKYTGVILCGNAHPPKLLTLYGLFVSSMITKFRGPKHVSPFLFNQLNDRNQLKGPKKLTSLSTRTAFDWLSRSNPVVGAYMHDPYCGFVCTASFYHDLMKMLQNITKKSKIRLTRKDIPIFVISGEKDPVGGCGKEVNKFLSVLKKCEFSNVSSKLYPECRHELLNELNNEEVYDDIQQWIAKRV